MTKFWQIASRFGPGERLLLWSAASVALLLLPVGCEPDAPAPPSPARELRRQLEQLGKQTQSGKPISAEQVAEVRRACDAVKETAVAGRGKGAMLDADTADRLARVERFVNDAFALSQGSSDKPADLRAAASALEQARFSAPAE